MGMLNDFLLQRQVKKDMKNMPDYSFDNKLQAEKTEKQLLIEFLQKQATTNNYLDRINEKLGTIVFIMKAGFACGIIAVLFRIFKLL